MSITEALLVLADGTVFEGEAIGATARRRRGGRGRVQHRAVGLSGGPHRPVSYAGQIVTFTYPHIGNYGVTPADDEARRPFCRGVIVRDLARRRSNWRSEADLDGVPAPARPRRASPASTPGGSPGISVTPVPCPAPSAPPTKSTLKAAASAEPGTDGVDLVAEVTTPEPYAVGTGPLRVVAYDFGIKTSILRQLAEFATVEVVPASTSAADALARRARRGVPVATAQAIRLTAAGAIDTVRRAGRVRGADVRDLPRPPDPRPSRRSRHRKAPVRPSRRQPPGARHGHRAHRDHQSEPQLRRRRRLARRESRDDPRQPERRCLSKG